MANLQIDPAELQPVIDQAVDAAVQRLAEARPAADVGKLLLSKREAAEAMSMSVSSLDRITVPRGDLPAVRLEGRVLYSPDAIRTWIRRREGEEQGEQSGTET